MSMELQQIKQDNEHDENFPEKPTNKLSSEMRRMQENTEQYLMVCRKRIKRMKNMQDKQFKHEIKNLEAMQHCAYDQVRFHRIFAITTLWPPLHSRKEIENTMKRFYGRTQWHIRRINFIIENTKTLR